MKKMVFAGLTVSSMLLSGGCCRCGAQDLILPHAVKPFDVQVKTLLPQLHTYEHQANQSFLLKDKAGHKLGILYLDNTPQNQRTIGYAGTVDTAIIVNNNQKIVGVLVGNNQETPGFLNRVKKSMLAKWQGMSMSAAATAQIDAVTGATLSSRAIQSGVKTIAAQASGQKIQASAQKMTAAERQSLLQRSKNLHAGLKFMNIYFKQWKTREADELAVRFIMATEGYKKGLAAAKAKNIKIFKRGKNGFKDQNILKLGAAYQKAPTATNKQALEAAILADFNDLKTKMVEHRNELRKSLVAVGNRLGYEMPQKQICPIAPLQKVCKNRQAMIKKAHELHRGLKFIKVYTKQWETREADELAVRFIMATEGYEKGLAAAQAKNIKIFKRGKNGFKNQHIVKLGAAYKKAPTAANKKALENAIRADFNDLKVKMNQHRDHAIKALKDIAQHLKQCQMKHAWPKHIRKPNLNCDRDGLIKQAKTAHESLKFISIFTKQWKKSAQGELQVRFVIATEGWDKGQELAKAKNLRIFKLGPNGFRDPQVLKLAEVYKKAPTAANKKALEDAIAQDFKALQKTIYQQRWALVTSLRMIGAKLNQMDSGKMRFRSKAAQAQEAKIVALAQAYQKAPSAELKKQLRAELTKQLDTGIEVMGKTIAQKEKELQMLKATYQRIGSNRAAAVDARLKKLINK